ncbi:MAG TPA: SGNH/GDSL hydrolase family protein [Vicinamibacteria bacterium]|nr:SGNH/GDSL hydrolase family protein [Vicinamibacteria bacterium]
MRRLRALLGNLALSLVALGLVVLVLEAALRVLGFATESELATRRMVDATWTRLLDCYPSNPRGYFDIDLRLPESRTRYRAIAPHRFESIARRHPWAVLSEYNHLRFRDLPPQPRPPAVERIVLFGDSFTEGQGVKEPDTLARLLETKLNASGPGRYQVRNCGRRGLDFPELMPPFETSLQYEPDLLVYALVLNDAARPPEFQARQQYVNDWILDRENPVDDEDAFRRGPRSRLLALVQDRLTAWRVGRATTRWYLDMWSDANPGWPLTQGYLRQMDSELKARRARLLVVCWPLLVGLDSGYPFEPVHRTLAAFCGQAGIPYHDLLPAFRGRRPADLWVHPVDRHPNEVAQVIAAESLLPVVRGLLQPR